MNNIIKKALNIAKKNGLNIWLPNIKAGDILPFNYLGILTEELRFDFLHEGEHDIYIYTYELGEDGFLKVVIEDVYDELQQEDLNATIRLLEVSLWIYE